MHSLRVHGFVPHSDSNGPGTRAVLWTQGCSLGCTGCFNPESHSFLGGRLVHVGELVRRLEDLEDSIEGLTISGGEPLLQPAAISELLRRVRNATPLSIILFSGFTWSEITTMQIARVLFDTVDVMVCGRFDTSSQTSDGLRSSTNQTVHFITDRYSSADLIRITDSEIVIEINGHMTMTGMHPFALK